MAESIENQFLTFGIDGEVFGVRVSRVREVLEYARPTKLPKAAEFLKGLINVRDVGIPVVDLRLRFGLPEIDATQDTAILVIEIDGADGSMMIGAIADAVYEVVDLDEGSLEPPPRFGVKIDAHFIRGIGKRDQGFIIILDMDKAFGGGEALSTETTGQAAAPAS